MPSSLLDLAGAKAQGNITTGENDVEMGLYVDAAVDLVEGLVGPVDVRTVTATVLRAGIDTGPFLLTTTPVRSIDAATAAGQAVDLTALTLLPDAGVVLCSRSLPAPVVLTLSVGRTASGETTPAAMRLATRMIFEHLWRTQRGNGTRGRGGTDDEASMPGAAWAVPNRAVELLRPWLLPPVVA